MATSTGRRDDLERTTVRKVSRRILPFLFVLYIIAYLDRVNLGYAALEMNADLGIAAEAFGLAAGIFFIGYFLFEVPSNVLLHRLGARVWIARILISWGLVVIATAWVANTWQLYALRFLLGLAEAGFFPGIILYLTYWFRDRDRARAVALFMSALPVSNIIGAPVSTWIIDHVHWFGWAGWRWMFILEGIPAVVFGLMTLQVLTDRPEQADWLASEEKAWLVGALREEAAAKPPASTWTAFRDGTVWLFSLIYFTLVVGLYGIGFWLPTITKGIAEVMAKAQVSNTTVGLIVVVPYVFGGAAMLLWSRRSDRLGERKWHTALPALVGAVGLFFSGFWPEPFGALVMLTVATVGIYSFFGPFWSFANQFLSAEAAPVGIAVINSIGNLGGFVGPYAVGYLKTLTGANAAGLYFLSASLAVSFILVTLVRVKARQAVV
ncbi:MFS transporter [Hydrogenibacillus schlegelii]|uniref:Major facilitator superfamily (MFS) profile domain-containing protein n=1 Tax=Hydrogenibacillus schlegelii TaxID=1484 RepID=A0A132N9D3_HYDSH|nr:MFS transporter [Hydrogenibacillus schlegelii]KWX06723.1 membrane protein [Hydrogenibacillus schlegelii]OAR04007.1 hypothetical protein SA87_00060 [Hydrogenibacillus schlegelii]